jgi:hypothetical protein
MHLKRHDPMPNGVENMVQYVPNVLRIIVTTEQLTLNGEKKLITNANIN